MPQAPMLMDYPEEERREVLPFIPPGAARVLDVGCSSGGFGRTLRGRAVWGVEPNPEAAARAEEFYQHVYVGVFPDAVPATERFDCIVFNDVLEHMVDPYGAVRASLEFLDTRGVVVASIPNVRYMRTLKRLVVNADWTYTCGGVLDHTHLRWFTYKTMRALFEDNGFEVMSISPINMERGWKARLLRLLPATADMPATQFVVVARPQPEGGA